MRNIGLFIILILWLLLGYWMCTCYCASCCEKPVDKIAVEKAVPVPIAKTVDCPDDPICFGRNDCEPHFGSGFADLRDSLIATLSDGQILRIIGTYGPSESNESDYDNLGICRAEAVKAEFAKVMDVNRFNTGGQLTVGQGALNNGVSSDRVRFDIVDNGAPKISSSTLIYFPYNSTNKLDDGDVEDYLDSVADQVKSSGERVRLTGHTDNVGSEGPNQRLGLKRAEVIRDYLVSQGVSSSKIIVSSRGETQPVTTNATESGRAKNRRTELEIIN